MAQVKAQVNGKFTTEERREHLDAFLHEYGQHMSEGEVRDLLRLADEIEEDERQEHLRERRMILVLLAVTFFIFMLICVGLLYLIPAPISMVQPA